LAINRSRAFAVFLGAAALLAAAGLSSGPAVASRAAPSAQPGIIFAPDDRPSAGLAGGRQSDAADPGFLTTSVYQFVPNDGNWAVMTVANPRLAPEDEVSYASIQVVSADKQFAAEFGWRVDRQTHHDEATHLLARYVVDGEFACPNCGFVQTDTTTVVGMKLRPGIAKFSIKHEADRWWFAFQGRRIGYFPDSLWGGRFTTADIATWGSAVVVASVSRPCSEMGTGRPASSPLAASMRIGFMSDTVVDVTARATNPDFYSISLRSPTRFRYGGPGAC